MLQMTRPLPTRKLDPAALKDAHGRTGKLLSQAGLPFEPEEFDDEQHSARDAEAAAEAAAAESAEADAQSGEG